MESEKISEYLTRKGKVLLLDETKFNIAKFAIEDNFIGYNLLLNHDTEYELSDEEKLSTLIYKDNVTRI